MEKLEFQKFEEMIKNGEINYEQIYNLDLDMLQNEAINHYIKYSHDNINIDQPLNILFHDIECYTNHSTEFKPETLQYPICAITTYSTFEKVYNIYFAYIDKNRNKIPIDISTFENELMEEFRNNKYTIKDIEYQYLDNDESIKIHFYNYKDELNMIKECFNHIHILDVSILSGFYCDVFDMPYIYKRTSKLLNNNDDEAAKILSKFGVVKTVNLGRKKGIINYPIEYPILDIQRLYKPRDENGYLF